MDVTRRRLLTDASRLALFTVAMSGAAAVLESCTRAEPTPTATPMPTPTATPAPQLAVVPWKYVKLDSASVAERGYAAYSQGGCMYGSFEGILGQLREQVGPPFDAFPAAMMKYGKAGVVGWGTLCGALNGASAAIYLVTDPKTGDALIDQLFSWYGQTALPNYRPKTPKFQVVQSVAESPLCHVSVTRWCETSGFKALSPERAERCGQLTASVAKWTAERLNEVADGKTVAALTLPSEVSGCLVCHGKGGPVENVHASRATACTICHEPHPLSK